MADESLGTPLFPMASGGKWMHLLNDRIVADTMQSQFYCDTIASQITTTQYNKHFNCLGNELVIMREPRGNSFEYCSDDADLPQPESFELTSITMKIRKAIGIRERLTLLQQAQSCKLKDVLMRKLAADVKDVNLKIERRLLRAMVMGAGSHNKGTNAGVHSRIYNLGVGGAPVSITSVNVLEVMSHVVGVLEQECTSMSSPFIVVPLEMMTILMNNPTLANACASGLNQSSLISGSIPSVMMGSVKVYFSHNVPKHAESGGRIAYSMPFGYRDATAFFFKEIINRFIDKDPNSYNQYWDRLYAYDFKVIDERLLGVLYATVTI